MNCICSEKCVQTLKIYNHQYYTIIASQNYCLSRLLLEAKTLLTRK